MHYLILFSVFGFVSTTIARGPTSDIPHNLPDQHGGFGYGHQVIPNDGWEQGGFSQIGSNNGPDTMTQSYTTDTPVYTPYPETPSSSTAAPTNPLTLGGPAVPVPTNTTGCTTGCSNSSTSNTSALTNAPGMLTQGPSVPTATSTGSTGPMNPSNASTAGIGNSISNSTSNSTTSNSGIVTGFNYASTVDFHTQFTWAKALAGTWTSARFYTMIAPGSVSSPISAIPAAINTSTTLLLGLFCSQGQANFTHETDALAAAIKQYGKPFTDLIIGISVGSEDLYRNSVTTDGIGDTVANLTQYIQQTKKVLSDAGVTAKVGHVDTWQIWTDSSLGGALIPLLDFIGVDAYPYWENATSSNSSAMTDALSAVKAVASGKEVWVTETGWPVNSAATHGQTVASLSDAETYWNAIGCMNLFGKINTWWYTLEDAKELASTPSVPSFGVVGGNGSALFNLTCSGFASGEVSRRRRRRSGVGRAVIGGRTMWES